jgi:ADP-ribose pyrophosphatase
MSSDYKVLKQEIIASPKNKKHQIVDITIQTPEGKEVVWQTVKTRDVVTVVAINADNKIYCVRQWRPAANNYVWELPAGGVEEVNPSSDQILQNANRELRQEIGLSAGKLELLTKFWPSIHIPSNFNVVLATDLKPQPLPLDPNESIEIKALPYEEAYDLMVNQQIPSALTLVGLLLVKNLGH